MDKKLKYYTIVLDGIDKTGKDLIAFYISELSEKRYLVYSRGIISMIAYSNLYKRDYSYEVSQQKNIVNVLLAVDEEDWNIRCKYTNEPKINYDENIMAFENAEKILITEHNLKILNYNTSKITPYNIAKDIIRYMNIINN